MAERQKGTLFGLGVGPGDPKLLTVRAVEVLKRVDVVFAAGSSKNEYSMAFNVVKEYLPEHTQVRRLNFPMTHDEEKLASAWRENAREVLIELTNGHDVAFITIGDPLTYSTFGYLLKTVRELEPQTKVETVPGITAYNAAAARLNMPLVESKESLLVVSGVCDPGVIPSLAATGDNVVIMKTYRNYDQIIDSLEQLDVPRKTYSISMCGLPEERIREDATTLRGEKMPYLSLVLVKGPKEA
ncbi:MAG: precorrin-2 C(20)-methyltransferase [Deltaproteobacteria bacterium]|nr:precorrin-2 C(20)-methyltransferase [Deltaproteobacteria bacterium]